MDDEIQHLIFGIVVGIFLTATVLTPMILYHWENDNEALGQAICEEEYNRTYEFYSDGKLKCKDRIAQETYDGLIVIEVSGE